MSTSSLRRDNVACVFVFDDKKSTSNRTIRIIEIINTQLRNKSKKTIDNSKILKLLHALRELLQFLIFFENDLRVDVQKKKIKLIRIETNINKIISTIKNYVSMIVDEK